MTHTYVRNDRWEYERGRRAIDAWVVTYVDRVFLYLYKIILFIVIVGESDTCPTAAAGGNLRD